MRIVDGECLPPPHRFKKNSNPVPLNLNDIRRINAYKLALRRELAKTEFDLRNESSMCKILQTVDNTDMSE
jgi:hypothetical protein